jgi:hypothetical protein
VQVDTGTFRAIAAEAGEAMFLRKALGRQLEAVRSPEDGDGAPDFLELRRMYQTVAADVAQHAADGPAGGDWPVQLTRLEGLVCGAAAALRELTEAERETARAQIAAALLRDALIEEGERRAMPGWAAVGRRGATPRHAVAGTAFAW